MKMKFIILTGMLVALAVALGGCATGLTASSWPGVTADADNAYIAAGPYVYAVNLQTGVETWRYPAKAATANPFYAAPVLTSDGQLIVGSFDHKLYSLNPQSGVENWRFEQAKDRWIGSVLVTADGIYAPNADYNLYALTLNGTPKWVTPFSADRAIWGSPVSDGTNIYFGTLGRNVYAVNAQTGKQVWDQKVDGAILGSPVLGPDGTLYVGTFAGAVISIDTANGNIISQQNTSSWIWYGPAQDGTYVYVGNETGMFYAFPMDSASQPWTQQLNGTIVASPLVIDKTIVVPTESGNIYFLDDTGKIIRSVTISGQLYSTPAAAGTLVLVAPTGGDNALVALDEDGSIKWSFTPAK
jgi:outer membrane protein assembly factor BamB